MSPGISLESKLNLCKYSINPLIRINWYAEPSGYVENPDNEIFLLE